MNQSAEMRSSLEFFATAHLFPEGHQPYKNEVYLLPTELDEASQRTHREHSPNEVVGNSSRAKLQSVSSEDSRSPVLGQAVNQSAEMRSAWEFFATAQIFIIHIFNTVHPFSVVVTASVIHGILA